MSKHQALVATLLLAAATTVQSQQIHTTNILQQQLGTFSVIGDSYSTFLGKTEPVDNAQYYPREGLDVYEPSQTWWMLFQRETGVQLEQNNSYSGGTICNTWWNGADASQVSFVYRSQHLRGAGLIVVEGGTNDNNAGSPLGSYQYDGWTAESLKSFRPATAWVLDYLQRTHPGALIVFMLNSGLRDDINASVAEICQHYNVPLLKLNSVSKALDHPTYDGMQTISRQLTALVGQQMGYTLFSERATVSATTEQADARVLLRFDTEAGQWTTMCLPFDLGHEQLEQLFGTGVQVAAFTGQADQVTDADGQTATVLDFALVEQTQRGVPYVVRPTLTRHQVVGLSDFTLLPSTAQTVTGTGGFQFRGVYRQASVSPTATSSFLVQPDGTLANAATSQILNSMHAIVLTPKGTTRMRMNIH